MHHSAAMARRLPGSSLPQHAPAVPSLTGSALPGLVLTGLALAAMVAAATPARAQKEVPKIGDICPLGYVDTLNGRCSTFGLMHYTVQPTEGKPCPEGWMNVGGEYCRRK